MNHNIFNNKKTYRDAFETGLVKLLDHEDLGVFILVLANAHFDQHVHNFTEHALQNKYNKLCRYFRHAILEGLPLKCPEDDIVVFLKLFAIDIDGILQTEFRQESSWELQFNHLRSMKPARVSNHKFNGIELDYDADGFNFNKDFLQKEILWEGELLDKPMSIFYNKFPFSRFHSLLVPDKQAEINQFLTPEYHQYIWDVCKHLSTTLPGLGLAYNSYGAFCSVNHLHFHLFIKEHPLPVMHSHWSHNGGNDSYPLQCEIFDKPAPAWDFINKLHQQHIAYNLIYQQDKLTCMVRKHQSDMVLPEWSGGFGWHEVSGGFTTFNHNDFNQLSELELNNALAALKIDFIK